MSEKKKKARQLLLKELSNEAKKQVLGGATNTANTSAGTFGCTTIPDT